jgi:hypothetical protein
VHVLIAEIGMDAQREVAHAPAAASNDAISLTSSSGIVDRFASITWRLLWPKPWKSVWDGFAASRGHDEILREYSTSREAESSSLTEQIAARQNRHFL